MAIKTTIDTTYINLDSLSDTGVLVLIARLAKEDSEEGTPEDWDRVIEYYTLYTKEVADSLIETHLKDTYLLDVETCKDWLVSDQEWQREQANKAAVEMYHSVHSILDAMEA